MEIFDITIPIHPDMPVWPGDASVQLERVRKIEEGANANVSNLALSVHTGTHVDAPCHFIPDGVALDRVPLERFIGEVAVVEIPGVDLITAAILHGKIPLSTTRIIFKTKNSSIWIHKDHPFYEAFTALSPDGAQYLVDLGIKFVGIDYLSIAPFKDLRPTHEILLGAGVVILEGVDLSAVTPGEYMLYCLPLKLVGVDGAPARTILVRRVTLKLLLIDIDGLRGEIFAASLADGRLPQISRLLGGPALEKGISLTVLAPAPSITFTSQASLFTGMHPLPTWNPWKPVF